MYHLSQDVVPKYGFNRLFELIADIGFSTKGQVHMVSTVPYMSRLLYIITFAYAFKEILEGVCVGVVVRAIGSDWPVVVGHESQWLLGLIATSSP